MPPDRRRSRALQLALGVTVSVLLIWLAFRKTDFDVMWTRVRTIHTLPMLGAIVIATLAFPLRVPRWRQLLRAPDGSALPARALWDAIAIGFAANNVIPLRTGEVLRAAAISRLTPVSFAAAASSIAVERVLDALTVITLLGIGLVSGGLATSGGIATTAQRLGALCLVALALAIVAAWQRDTALRLFERMLPTGPFATKLVAFVDNVLRGLSAMRDPRRALPVIAWSFVIWLFTAAAFFLAFKAFDFPLPYSAALVLQGILMIGIAAPSAPSAAGAFEAAAVIALTLYGIDNNGSAAYGVTYHVTTWLPITALGAASAWRNRVAMRRATAPLP